MLLFFFLFFSKYVPISSFLSKKLPKTQHRDVDLYQNHPKILSRSAGNMLRNYSTTIEGSHPVGQGPGVVGWAGLFFLFRGGGCVCGGFGLGVVARSGVRRVFVALWWRRRGAEAGVCLGEPLRLLRHVSRTLGTNVALKSQSNQSKQQNLHKTNNDVTCFGVMTLIFSKH